ncbi:MAG: SDR family oxidoreductase, partial [Chloroflexota bacterium]
GLKTVRLIEQSNGAAAFVRGDVANPQDNQRMIEAAVERFGRLDIAFNNAGISGESNPTHQYSIEGWDRVIAINLSGVFYGMKYQIPAMLSTGGGAIVNNSSILGQAGWSGSPAYVAAKHGVIGLTRTAAIEYATAGLRVNAIGPAFIVTPMIGSAIEDAQSGAALAALHPVGRLGRVEEVAELVIWLSSDKASFVTGAYYPVDGGYLAR